MPGSRLESMPDFAWERENNRKIRFRCRFHFTDLYGFDNDTEDSRNHKRTYLKSLLLLRPLTPLASPSRDPLFLFTDRSDSAVWSSLFSLSLNTRTTLSSEIAPSDGFQSAASFAAEGNNAPRFLRRCFLVVIGARDFISSTPGAAVASGFSRRDIFTGTQQETNSKRNFIGKLTGVQVCRCEESGQNENEGSDPTPRKRRSWKYQKFTICIKDWSGRSPFLESRELVVVVVSFPSGGELILNL